MSAPPEPSPAASPAASLEDFAAGALDWPAVRAVLERHVASSLGRRALAELGPRADDDARDALTRTDELLAVGPEDQPSLAGLTDPVPALDDAHAYRRSLEPLELAELAGFLRAAAGLASWLRTRAGKLPRLAALGAGMPELTPLREALEAAVDARGEVRDDASPALARLRRVLAELTREVEETVRRMAGRADLRGVLADGHAGKVHRRGGRPVLAVKARSLGQVPGLVHDRSQSGETLFVEPREVVEAGNRIAASRVEESREVARVLAELTRRVLAERAQVEAAAARLAELELAVTGAAWARRVGGRPARLPGEPGAARGLLLRGFRHPLLIEEKDAGHLPEVVPIDLRLGADFDLLVVTGPNTGGKTAAVKGAGLAALMTRLGLPLACAEGTTVPLYDGVVADIGDEQELSQNLSTFSSHLVRIRRGLERAGPKTLVLLDELGGGTDPDEGAALGDAILETLLERGAPTLATTHIGRLKHFAFRHARAENACAEFDALTLRPLYRLVVGAPGESRALAIARRCGLDPELLERAAGRLVRTDADAERLMEDLVDSRVEAERLLSEAEDRREEIEREARELDHRGDRLGERERLVEAEAQRGLEERLRDAGAWLERGRALLPQLSPAQRERFETVLAGFEEALGRATLGERRLEFLAGLKKGALVYLPKFKKRCPIVRIEKQKERVVVRLGKRELSVGFDEVTMYESL